MSLGQVLRMAEALSSAELARQREVLTDCGLLGRLPSTAAETVFDTVPEPQSHLVYEETGQTVDLHLSPETLLVMVRQVLAEYPGRVQVLVRVRRQCSRSVT